MAKKKTNDTADSTSQIDFKAVRRALTALPVKDRPDAIRALMPSDATTPGFPGSLEELQGLMTGIRSAVQIARQHYDSDHLDFEGLYYLVERAELVLMELDSELRKPQGARTGGAL